MCKEKSKMSVLVFVLVLLFSFVVSIPLSMAQSKKPIKLGFISNTTGYYAGLGLEVAKGVNLAVEDENKKGGLLGRELEIVFVDGESSLAKVTTIAKRFVYEEKVSGIMGPEGTALAIAVGDICEKEGVPEIWNGPGERVAEGRKFLFSGTYRERHYARASASIATDYLKLESIGIIPDAAEYSMSLVNPSIMALKEYGDKVKVVGIEKYPSESLDCTPQVLKIKEGGAKGVIFTSVSPHVPLKNLREIGWNVPIIGTWCVNDLFLKVSGKDAEGVIGVSFRGAGLGPEHQAAELQYFFKLYRGKYGIDPTLFAIIGWDYVKLFAHAIEMAKSDDPKMIRDALENTKGFRTAAGEVNMSRTDHHGRSAKDMGIVIAKGGKWIGFPWTLRE